MYFYECFLLLTFFFFVFLPTLKIIRLTIAIPEQRAVITHIAIGLVSPVLAPGVVVFFFAVLVVPLPDELPPEVPLPLPDPDEELFAALVDVPGVVELLVGLLVVPPGPGL